MVTLTAITEDHILSEETELASDASSSDIILTVDNNDGFSEDDYVVIGRLGNDQTELKQIGSVSDSDGITLKNGLNFTHDKNTVLTKTTYDQRKFYRASSKDGTYSHLSEEGSPVDLEVDNPRGTSFEDTTGTTTSWYKATYYNSTTSTETDLSNAIAGQAGEADHYTSIYKVKDQAGFGTNQYISDSVISDYRREAESEIDGRLAADYNVPFSTVPDIITHITTLVAAGNMLIKEYGEEADVEVSKTGQRMLDRAYGLLEKIENDIITLVDEDGNVLTESLSMLASCGNTYDSEDARTGRFFNLSDENFQGVDFDDDTGTTSTLK